MPKLSWKGNPQADPPFSGSLPPSLLWSTLGDCASLSTSHITFSTQHCQPASSTCPPSFHLQLPFARGKWAMASQAYRMIFLCTSNVMNRKSLSSAPPPLKQDVPFFIHASLFFFSVWQQMIFWKWSDKEWQLIFPLIFILRLFAVTSLCGLVRRIACCGQSAPAAASDCESMRCNVSQTAVWSSCFWPEAKQTDPLTEPPLLSRTFVHVRAKCHFFI